MALANDEQTSLALVVIDIDGFARINAAHGFDFGDRVLHTWPSCCARSRARRTTSRASATTASR